ncbi:MAG: hypothetical protein WCK67_11900 [bacterium]
MLVNRVFNSHIQVQKKSVNEKKSQLPSSVNLLKNDTFELSITAFTSKPKSTISTKAKIAAIAGTLLLGVSMCNGVNKNSSGNPSNPDNDMHPLTEQVDKSFNGKAYAEEINLTASINDSSSGLFPMKATTEDPRAIKYEKVLEVMKIRLTDSQKLNLKEFQAIYKNNIDKYESVARALGYSDDQLTLAGKAIAAIHYREGGGDFKTYLHNGNPLGEKTTSEPYGIFFKKSQWKEAAVDAIKRDLGNYGYKLPESLPEWCSFAEVLNGTGYEKNNMPSPYILSGTNQYEKGKYTSDNTLDKDYKDPQIGFAVLVLKAYGQAE